MKVYQTSEIKKFDLIGSAVTGKTNLPDQSLYKQGIIKPRAQWKVKIP